MKKLLLFLLTISTINSFSQITITPNSGFAICPNQPITYSVISNGACNYYWEISGGTFSGGATTTTAVNVTVTWNTTSTTGVLKATAQSCSPEKYNGGVASATYKIKSLYQAETGVMSGQPTVAINSNTSTRYTAGLVRYPRGSSDPNPYFVADYVWTVPTGWIITGAGNDLDREVAYIDVTPDACTGGIVKVKAKSSCGNYYSNERQLQVNRVIQTPGSISGPNSVICSNTSALSYSVPVVTGAISYAWTMPSGWSGTSTSNSIIVTPSGSTSGNVCVRAVACGIQSSPSCLPVALNLYDPANPPYAITNFNAAICSVGNSVLLINQPPNTSITWQASPANLLVSSSGTSTNAFLQAVDNFNNGQGSLTFSIQGQCGTVTRSKDFWIGRVQSQVVSDIHVTGNQTPTQYFTYGYGLTYLPSGQGNISYRWQVPSDWNITFNADYLISVQVSANPGSVEAFWQNECGIETGTYLYVVPGIGGGGCCEPEVIYPNPSSESLTVQFENDNEKQVRLINEQNDVVFESIVKNKIKIIPISHLPEGIYYLIIVDSKSTKKERVVIKR
jgi:large repetitive protein